MIRYALLCGQDHAFEAWFRDSDAFDRQNDAGHVACPACGSAEVRKAVMAPAVRRSRPGAPSEPAAPAALPSPTEQDAPAPPQPRGPIGDEAFGKIRAALRELHKVLKQNAENVGSAFPDQARLIHDGEAPPRAIYGTATEDEVHSLLEDGVAIMPIPNLPDDRN